MRHTVLILRLSIACLPALLGGCVTMDGPTPFESSGVIAPTPTGCTPDVDC